MAGLTYEVLWLRQLNLIFGVTAFALSVVLAAFMGGLALGSYIFGRLADRLRTPLMVYAALEAGIGINSCWPAPYSADWIASTSPPAGPWASSSR